MTISSPEMTYLRKFMFRFSYADHEQTNRGEHITSVQLRWRRQQDHAQLLQVRIHNGNRKKDNLPTFACYIDLTRAFDGINRTLLWHKLMHYKVDGKLLHIIKTMYEHVQSAVRIGHELADWFSVKSGVRQGDNLAPTLFAIYINDFMQEIQEVNKGVRIGDEYISGFIYADDVVLIAGTPEDLQAQLDVAHAWCVKWRLRVNLDKTKTHIRVCKLC